MFGPDLLSKRRPRPRVTRYQKMVAERDEWRELATQRGIKISNLEILLRAKRHQRNTW